MMYDPYPRVALLRSRTRDAHASIEKVPLLGRLMSPGLSAAEYVAVLGGLYVFHATIEPRITQVLEPLPDAVGLLDGARTDALASDLAWFGESPPADYPAIPVLGMPHQALGALYVIEGASLGGRVIARHVSASLGVTPGRGGSFYGGLSAESARERWALLAATLDGPVPIHATVNPVSPMVANEAMATAACETFECLERWMRRLDVARSHRPLAEAAAA